MSVLIKEFPKSCPSHIQHVHKTGKNLLSSYMLGYNGNDGVKLSIETRAIRKNKVFMYHIILSRKHQVIFN